MNIKGHYISSVLIGNKLFEIEVVMHNCQWWVFYSDVCGVRKANRELPKLVRGLCGVARKRASNTFGKDNVLAYVGRDRAVDGARQLCYTLLVNIPAVVKHIKKAGTPGAARTILVDHMMSIEKNWCCEAGIAIDIDKVCPVDDPQFDEELKVKWEEKPDDFDVRKLSKGSGVYLLNEPAEESVKTLAGQVNYKEQLSLIPKTTGMIYNPNPAHPNALVTAREQHLFVKMLSEKIEQLENTIANLKGTKLAHEVDVLRKELSLLRTDSMSRLGSINNRITNQQVTIPRVRTNWLTKRLFYHLGVRE